MLDHSLSAIDQGSEQPLELAGVGRGIRIRTKPLRDSILIFFHPRPNYGDRVRCFEGCQELSCDRSRRRRISR
jgi:hypothetical protein